MSKSSNVVERIASRTNTGLAADTVARITWGCIATPGDLEVGALIRERGASDALQLVLTAAKKFADGFDLNAIRSRLTPRTTSSVRVCLECAEANGFVPLTPLDRWWPARVDALGDAAPLLLWLDGRISDLAREPVAVVGVENLTVYGTRGALALTAGIVGRGWAAVTSTDTGAAECVRAAAVKEGGSSITVSACGLDQVEIFEGGSVVSEYPIGSRQSAWKQLRSYRLIAALSSQTVIVEPEIASPVLTVADQAVRLGRPVGIVEPDHARRGSDRFARWFGARPVQTFNDLLPL
ncbi:MAG TPA: DNA-processing protein DprA [Galbitalea sp.]|nr:DNA-processing protein DprA [Galbitalea sp.]